MNNEIELVNNIREYYAKSISVFREFGGPSVYFHVEAIKEQRQNFMSDRHIEMIYATLASWGLHRMGDPDETKAKMVDFDAFKKSLISQSAKLTEYRDLSMDTCTAEQYDKYIASLKDVYYSFFVSISDATIVAHSKTFAHILPNFVPPIDRQYTIRFFTQDNKDFFTGSGKYKAVAFPQGLEKQFNAFKDYCVRIKQMFDRCDKNQFVIDLKTFNTSYPKIMDNAIMAFVKSVPKPI